MAKFRVVTSVCTSYVVEADQMVPFQGDTRSDVAFTSEKYRNGGTIQTYIAYVRAPVIVYEVSHASFAKEDS
jgi:hypothetical protein